MQKLATAVIQLDENDHTLQKRYENYKMQWEKLLSIIDKNTSSEVNQHTERSEDYNQKYVLFCDIHLLTGSAFRSCNVFYYVVSFIVKLVDNFELNQTYQTRNVNLKISAFCIFWIRNC